MADWLKGVIPVIPCPFLDDEEIDLAALKVLIGFAIRQRASCFVLPAFASEFYKLSDQERAGLIEAAVETAAGRIPVIAQCNHPSASAAAAMARRAAAAGVGAI